MHRFLFLLASTLIFCSDTPLPEAAPATPATPSKKAVPAEALGVGIAMPDFTNGQPLYFYGIPDFTQLPGMMTPLDSVVFGQGPDHVDIMTAPPWFVPEVLKMDYDMLFLRAITLSKNWVEVVVNRFTGETRWIDAQAVRFVDWPRFLLDIAAVEVLDAAANPIRVKPLDYAGILAEAPDIPLGVLAIQGSWMQVSTNGVADRIVPTGWIRWRDGDDLLISYSPLS